MKDVKGIGNKVINKKMVLFSVIILILILLVNGLAYSMIGSQVDTTTLQIRDIAVTSEKLNIAGTTSSSAQAFTRYSYTIVNDSLYLTLRYVLVNPFHRNGDFDITIDDNLIGINKVYLQGKDDEDLRLVWGN